MKNIIYFLTLSLVLFMGCDEIPPQLNTPTGGPDIGGPNDIENQMRQVIIEEFTGVQCVNCPAGSAAIEALIDIHEEQLIAVSIHAGFFSPPYDESLYDFRTPAGSSILAYLGSSIGYPTAVVNRKLFPSEFDLQLGQSLWPGYIINEIAVDPLVKIGIDKEFNSSSRELKVNTTLYVQENITADDVRLTIMITENNIEDIQLTPAGKKADYKHKHVLRGTITPFDGMPITEDLIANAQIENAFTYSLPEGWVASNCKVIAFVSLTGDSKEVLQAHEIGVAD